jgi:uncharacterized GH25 family protein
VQLRDMQEQSGTTGADGIVQFKGVSPGWAQVIATKTGFAPGDGVAVVGTGGITVQLEIVMRGGATVSGKVVDEAGKPIANARVVPRDAGRFWQPVDVLHDAVVTSADGTFAFPALAAGSYRFGAFHDMLAPGDSATYTIDGTTPTTGVEIVLKAGGVIRGIVRDTSKQPVPHASVRVGPGIVDGNMMAGFGGNTRQVTADEDGTFEIRALSRTKLRLRAESETATSKIVDVDLSKQAEQSKVELILDVTGMIAGVVVDAANDPVPEVQVSAFPDMFKGAELENMAMSGFSTATTDGGGRFTIRGLADGDYRVWAYRSQAGANPWSQQGTPAKPGDLDLRIVLPKPGGIKGKIVLAGGGPPKLATVSIGWAAQTPAVGGAFSIDDVQPGDHDVTFRGPEFAELIKPDVKVEPGKVTDIGTITVKRGRRLAGRVVDKNGAPVANARVKVGKMLWSQGNEASANDDMDQMFGLRVAVTGEDGGFAVVGISPEGGLAVAEHPDRGRSAPLQIAAGDRDPPDATMTLRGFGSITGKVTSKGEPVAKAMVMVSPKGAAQIVSVQSGDDGTYVIDKVAEGEHKLSAMRPAMMSMGAMGTKDVVVTAGQRLTADIALPVGDIKLVVEVKPKPGETVNAAQVFLLRGTAALKWAKELMDAFTGGGAEFAGMEFWWGGPTPATFKELLPGKHSICTIPITGDMSDPVFQARLNQNSDKLAVYCAPYEIAPEPKEQRFVHEVPSMTPLPSPAPP